MTEEEKRLLKQTALQYARQNQSQSASSMPQNATELLSEAKLIYNWLCS